MSPFRFVLTMFFFCVGLLVSQTSYAFRCGSDLITEGDSKISVLKKCGDPSWIDRWLEEIVDLPDTNFEHRITRINERWVYNPGPTQFLRIITFKDSKVLSIDTGGRGFTPEPGTQHCNFDIISLGSTTAEVNARCGEPDLIDQRYETITRRIAGGRRQVTVTVDEWTFNLGPTRFMRTLTFRNGNLVDIQTNEKGFH